MKYKIYAVLVTVLLLNLSSPNIIRAQNSLSAFDIEQKITELKTQIQYLKQLINSILLQKEIVSGSYIVVDIKNGSVVAEKNSNKEYPIASITKLMNAVVSVENIDLKKTITLNSEMLMPEGYSPSLYLNLEVTAKDLLYASLIQSTNDAAEALSYFIGNTKFISLMNQKAKDLNMSSTFYFDAHGLNPNNHSTASDLSKLLLYIYNNYPEILSITKENNFWLPDKTGRLLKFQNVSGFHNNPDFTGAKSGYLPEAKQTLASVASVNGRPVALVLLYSPNRKTDALKIIDWTKTNFILK